MALLFRIHRAAGFAVARYTASDALCVTVDGFEDFVTFMAFLFTGDVVGE